jgi:Raf kinase inhibitor-like YbhB/YbcL family protein
MRKALVMMSALMILFCTGQSKKETAPVVPTGGEAMKIIVASPAFIEGGMIPKKYSCDAENVSPPLAWSGIPDKAKSLALIVDDPDAPAGDWVHWVVYNMPVTMREMPEDIGPDERVAGIGIQGKTDFGKIGYGGPCPPSGTHRYFFRLYALDKVLDAAPGLTKAQLLQAMAGHVLAQGELMGRYKR